MWTVVGDLAEQNLADVLNGLDNMLDDMVDKGGCRWRR